MLMMVPRRQSASKFFVRYISNLVPTSRRQEKNLDEYVLSFAIQASQADDV